MSRRRSIPWIQRWSRPITAAIATVGAIGTGYLTLAKFTNSKAICPTEGCDIVLNSNYAEVFGLPLSLFGLLAYLAMGLFAIAPLLINGDHQKDLRLQLEKWTQTLLFIGGTAMAAFSAYLMYIMAFEIKHLCLYCIASAIMSLGLLLLAILGHHWEDIGQLLFNGIITAMVVLVGTLSLYASLHSPNASSSGNAGPPVQSISSPAAVQLAQHLTQTGAKMYGAYWCPHCHDQKELFGQEAAKQIPYVECDAGGVNPKPDECRAAGVEGFPTWSVKGQLLSGAQPLEDLAKASGYTGPNNFAP